jgi:hypothetical protein
MEMEMRGLRPASEEEKHKMDMWATKRAATINAISDCGLVLMLYYSRDRDEIFMRVAAEGGHLRQVAQMKKHRLELKPQYLSAFAEFRNDYAGRRDLNYSDRCVVNHLYKVHTDPTDTDHGHRYPLADAIFRTTDRIQLIDYIIRANGHNCAGVDMGQLMHDGDVLHYFALHENQLLRDMDQDWFKTFAWGTHIDKVRDYFGERIAMYFLFMSFLNKWLIAPAVFGLLFCLYDMVKGTPDNQTEVIVCIGMGAWAVFFIHFWRRRAAEAACKWGTFGMECKRNRHGQSSSECAR